MEGLDLPGIWSLSPLAALTGFIVLVGIALVLGWLIPKRSHEREVAQLTQWGAEWRETAKEQASTIATQNDTIHTLTETVAVQAKGQNTAAEALGTITRGGGDHVAT